jgi:peptide/nickel transport system permease protein
MAYLVRRIIHSIILLAITISIVFLAGRMIGDPALNILGLNATEQALETLRVNLGLNDPLWLQYLRFMGDVVQGDFGVSYRFGFSVLPAEDLRGAGQAVLPIVLQRLPATFFLAAVAMVFALPLSVLMGVTAAVYPRSLVDRAVTVLSLAGVSIVQFWLGLMLIVLFAVKLGWLPTTGYGGIQYVVLPAFALAARPMGRIAQVVRSSMLDELSKPYVNAARAKGATEKRIVFVHCLKNAAIPIVTMTGDETSALLTGAILVETVFAWPGIGLLLIDSLNRGDLPIVQAGIFVVAALVIMVNLLVDISYTFLDPKVKLRNR